ncbi:hypothetical protein SAMN04488541_1001176 [Thermoflexibacter ruber]|uniref:Uncharacterized protein n=1 Tax=Thermoflexibacter ruber TaxID=1003 RepID=A0A1I2AHE2_9BACT|nr:hypothetical protein SAMN04488541_1001176 [Thermoflexibacter ruber]
MKKVEFCSMNLKTKLKVNFKINDTELWEVLYVFHQWYHKPKKSFQQMLSENEIISKNTSEKSIDFICGIVQDMIDSFYKPSKKRSLLSSKVFTNKRIYIRYSYQLRQVITLSLN